MIENVNNTCQKCANFNRYVNYSCLYPSVVFLRDFVVLAIGSNEFLSTYCSENFAL